MRSISKEFIEDLKTGVLSDLTSLVKNSNDLVFCFRENYINVYYKCRSMFKITEMPKYKCYKVDLDIMYLRYIKPENREVMLSWLKDRYNIYDNSKYLSFNVEKSGGVYDAFEEISDIYRKFMDEWFECSGKKYLEKEIQQQIFIKQLKKSNLSNGYLYYDLEFAMPNHQEYGRVDLLGVKLEEGCAKSLVFTELKSNEGACSGGTSDVAAHLNKYAGMMNEDYDFYSDMCFAIETYKELGFIDYDLKTDASISKTILLLFSDEAINWLEANENNLPQKVDEYDVLVDTVCLKQRSELHLHTAMSTMDGINVATEYINAAIYEKMPAIAITDHASVQAFPEAYNTMKKYIDMDFDFKLIYGNEIYMVNDIQKVVKGTTNRALTDDFVVVDVETTGLNPTSDKITEIAAYKIKDGKICDTYTDLINPNIVISDKISEITGITNEMLENAGKIEKVMDKFLAFCGNSIIVAHNAEFDISFLKKSAIDCGREFDPVSIDTLALSRTLLPELVNYKLTTICEALNIDNPACHRAGNDARATAEIFLILCDKLRGMGVNRVDEINDILEPSYKGQRTHASVLVLNKIGLKNLYKLVSLANTDYFYKVPITPKSELVKYRDGLLIGSGCDCGELYHAIREGKSDDELLEIASFYDYLEIVPTDNFRYYIDCDYVQNEDELVGINRKIVEIGEMTNKLVVAVSDAHYVHSDDIICRKIIMNHQGYDEYNNQPDLSMKTTDEMLKEFAYLGRKKAFEIVVENTNKIADLVDDLFSPIDTEANYKADIRELVDLTYEKLHEKYGENVPQECLDRIDVELSKIGKNSISIYNILLSSKLANKAKDYGWTVGNRGSVASSFVAYLLGITEVNPMEAHYHCPKCHYVEFHSEYNCGIDMMDRECACGTKMKKDGFTIPCETFLGTDGSRDIDIDFNFPPEYQKEAMKHLEELVGGNVIRCGTLGTIPYKTACAMIENYSKKENIVLDEYDKEEIADKISRVKRVTGVHPGGIYIIPDGKNVLDYTPVQHPADFAECGIITTHFDYYSLYHLLKVDILAHDMHAMIKHLEELTKVNSKDIPLDDQKTLELFNALDTKGIPEFSHVYVKNVVMPHIGQFTFDNLIRISGACHGTGVWDENGSKLIQDGKTISEITSCRDDVMLYLVSQDVDRNEAYTISERIRKGKGLTEIQYSELLDMGVERWRLDSWNKIKYSFPRAHAASYVWYAYKIAYYKAHFPLEFYCAYFSAYVDDFDVDVLINNSDCLEKEITKLSAESSQWSNYRKLDMMEVCKEMYDKGFEFVSKHINNEPISGFFIENGKLRPKVSL